MSKAFVNYAFPTASSPHTRTAPARFNDIVNAKDYGAKGDGNNNDTTFLQAAIDAAFGTAASPNSDAKRFLNAQLFIPNGIYNIDAPLVLTQVEGGVIFGAGKMATQIRNTAVAGGAGYGSIFQTNGWLKCIVKDIHLKASAHTVGSSNVCFDLNWDGIVAVGNSADVFRNVRFESGDYGVRIGLTAQGSEVLFIGCDFVSCVRGVQGEQQNALNFMILGGKASLCTFAFSTYDDTRFTNPCSNFPSITGVRFIDNGIDILYALPPMSIEACYSESQKFLDCAGPAYPIQTTACWHHNTHASPTYCQSSQGKLVMDGCLVDNASEIMKDTATVTNGVYMRANNIANANFVSGSTAPIPAIIQDCNGLTCIPP